MCAWGEEKCLCAFYVEHNSKIERSVLGTWHEEGHDVKRSCRDMTSDSWMKLSVNFLYLDLRKSHTSRILRNWIASGDPPRLILLSTNSQGNLVFFVVFRCHTVSAPIHQELSQVVCSNREPWKRLVRRYSRNGPWSHGCCFAVMSLYVGSGFRNWNDYYYYYDHHCVIMFFFPSSCFPFFPGDSFVSFPYSFLEFIKCVCGLRWTCCGGGVACCVECTNVVKKW